jgi:hypothetical protein
LDKKLGLANNRVTRRGNRNWLCCAARLGLSPPSASPPFSRRQGSPAHHASIARRYPRHYQPPFHESALLLAPAGAAGCEQRGVRACSAHSCGHVPDRSGMSGHLPFFRSGGLHVKASRPRALLRSQWKGILGSIHVFIASRAVACSTLACPIGARLPHCCNRCARCTLHTRASGALPLASRGVTRTRWRRATFSCT